MAMCMNTETDQIIRNIQKMLDVLGCVRQRTREEIGVFNPFWGVDSCFKLGRKERIFNRGKMRISNLTYNR